MKYNHSRIEKKWQKIWRTKKVHEPNLSRAKNSFYNLMMFPYPSAEGLHVGNMYAFTGADIYGRFKRMQGNDVFEPIGLDGFGIHSENYALKIGAHPMKQAKVSEKRFYKQLEAIGNSYAWNEKLETYDPEYYRWTQWLFIQLFKKGLAYRKKASVNWCPSCKTVLADEQVVAGKCERCGTEVTKRDLEQWFFKITEYAEKLFNNIPKLDWSEKVKIAQRNWIGKSEGARITFALRGVPGQQDDKHSVEVFTTRPDTLFGATFIALSAEVAKKWVDVGWRASDEIKRFVEKTLKSRKEIREGEEVKEKEGVETGLRAVNPANKEEIPVWVVNYVLGDVGTGAIMGVPAHDERDWEFAKKYNLPAPMVVCPNYPEPKCPVLDHAYTGGGHLVGSGKFDGVESEKAKWEITKEVSGERKTQYRLRDWLISRQRYWGPPIPMIFCETCKTRAVGERKDMPGWHAVPEKDLPAKLPFVKDFRPTGTGTSPLATVKKFYQVKCPKCKSLARRETDVSDTFLDSAWYFFRYLDPKNKKQPFDKARVKKWLPVAMYTGGAEHSVLHLLYTRFITMVLRDLKLIDFEEPFSKFRAHGLIIKDGAKMSKSKGNVVNPDFYIKEFGADALRMYLMFLGPFEQGGDFQDRGILGITRFFERVWKFSQRVLKGPVKAKPGEATTRILHQTIKKVTKDIESLSYNTAVSALMILSNALEKEANLDPETIGVFLKLLNPFAPHLAHELWSSLSNKTVLDKEEWPRWREELIQEEIVDLIVQISGKFRATVNVPKGSDEENVRRAALQLKAVKKWTDGKTIERVIFVPDRLINFLVK